MSAFVLLILLLVFQVCYCVRLPTSVPYNIAHRGANGEIPEESVFAYKRAIEEGADFIEADIVTTKDGQLICFHDTTLDAVTDVADHPEFSGRKKAYMVDGAVVTGFFTVDFTLEEIKTLRLRQRFTYRDQAYNGEFEIPTFEEYIAIALNAKRTVGLYPEIKNPEFLNQHVKWSHGRIIEDVVVETLHKYGYHGKYLSKNWLQKPLFIQSFNPNSLVYISNKTDSPKLLLISSSDQHTFQKLTSDSFLDYISSIVVGIGPDKESIRPVDRNNRLLPATDLVDKAHARGLLVHAWTFRNEHDTRLPFDYHQDPYLEYDEFVRNIGVDGVFTDFPQTFENYRRKFL